MDIDSRFKEKQEIVKRYFETERKLMLAKEEIEKLISENEELKTELEKRNEKIQTLLSHINA